MATQRSFQAMLNEYLPNKLLKEEYIKRDFVLSTIEKDDKWKGGKLIVPFKASGASSVKMGGLTAAGDIAEDLYVRGSIDDYKEMWGSMVFNQRDLMDHSGRVVEDSFLKLLPGTITDFMEHMKMTASVQMGTGPHFATLTANGTAGGVIQVNHIERLCLNQKIVLKDANTAAANYYVIAINLDADTATVSATRGGAAADVSAYTTADAAKVYTEGADVAGNTFTSIKDTLLSAANGGSATVHGQSKLAYPFLQALNFSGATISASNLIEKIFDAYVGTRKKSKGNATIVLMSYKHYATALKILQSSGNLNGNYQLAEGEKSAVMYGWDEMYVSNMKGPKLKFVGIQEWDDDCIVFLDKTSMTFRSNGFFQKRKSPEGQEYFEVRNTSGFQYILDVSLFGELEISKPGHNAIIHSIPNY